MRPNVVRLADGGLEVPSRNASNVTITLVSSSGDVVSSRLEPDALQRGMAKKGDAPRGHRWHWSVVVGAACLMTAGEFIFLSASILNPDLARALSTGLSEVMVYNSLQSLGGVIATALLMPMLLRRFGVRTVVVVAGLWTAATLAAVAVAPDLPVLYALGFASGLSFGVCTFMAGSVLIIAWFEHKQGTVMGAAFAVSALGGVATGLVLPSVVEAGGYGLGFLTLAGVVVALVVLPALFLIRSAPSDVGLRPYGARVKPASDSGLTALLPGVPAARAFRSPQFAALALGVVLFGMVQAVQQHFAPMMVERGVSLAVAGMLISLLALTMIAGYVAVGTLNDRRGSGTAVLVASVCQLVALAGYLLSTGVVTLAAFTVVFAFAVPLGGVLVPILVMLLFGPRDYAAILGPGAAMMPLGLALGTPLWGVALDITGSYAVALGAATAVTIVSGGLLLWAVRTASGFRSRVERELGEPGLVAVERRG